MNVTDPAELGEQIVAEAGFAWLEPNQLMLHVLGTIDATNDTAVSEYKAALGGDALEAPLSEPARGTYRAWIDGLLGRISPGSDLHPLGRYVLDSMDFVGGLAGRVYLAQLIRDGQPPEEIPPEAVQAAARVGDRVLTWSSQWAQRSADTVMRHFVANRVLTFTGDDRLPLVPDMNVALATLIAQARVKPIGTGHYLVIHPSA